MTARLTPAQARANALRELRREVIRHLERDQRKEFLRIYRARTPKHVAQHQEDLAKVYGSAVRILRRVWAPKRKPTRPPP